MKDDDKTNRRRKNIRQMQEADKVLCQRIRVRG